MNPSALGGAPVIAIVGATAVGKSELAVRLAEAIGGEIISLDSRQMYRRVDVGTAKPTPDERARVPHHMIDIADPAEPLSLADVQARAYSAAAAIRMRYRVPLLVGGTGQYMWAVLEGWRIPEVEPDADLRESFLKEADEFGPVALHARLAEIDPVSAERIHPNNVRRVIRALEVWHHAGVPMSQAQAREGPPWPIMVAGLRMPREQIYARADARIDTMIAEGLEAEVRGLVESGLHFGLPALQSVGYREWLQYLAGEIEQDEVIRLIRRNTRRLVRMQSTWFREDDPRIRWYDVGNGEGESEDEGEGDSAARALVDAIEADYARTSAQSYLDRLAAWPTDPADDSTE